MSNNMNINVENVKMDESIFPSQDALRAFNAGLSKKTTCLQGLKAAQPLSRSAEIKLWPKLILA